MTSDAARQAAGILAQCKWLRDNIKQWEDQAKDVLSREVSAGERVKAIALDGTEIGSVTRAEGARSMQITNEDGFLMWVKQRYPTEVVETVRPSFVKVCAEKVKALGGLPDANGELCPHVSLEHADPKSSVSIGDNDRAQIENMFMSRHVPDVMAALNPPGVVQGDAAVASLQQQEWDAIQERAVIDAYAEVTGYEVSQSDSPEPEPDDIEPEPFIEEGPPNWPESNTFETSDSVRKRR